MRHLTVRLIGDKQFHHHPAGCCRPVRLAVDDHALGWRADTGCRKHPLALDLDHAGTAIAVRPVTGIILVTQMWDVGAKAGRGLPDGLAILGQDFLAIKREADLVCCHFAPDERRMDIPENLF